MKPEACVEKLYDPGALTSALMVGVDSSLALASTGPFFARACFFMERRFGAAEP